MDIDGGETSQPRSSVHLPQLPNDDFGVVRERRDFGPMDTPLHPILPSPYRDASFSGLTGWRYYPTANQEDRLGLGSGLDGRPSTVMVIPESWNDRVIDHTKATESTRRQMEKLKSWEDSKRRRISPASGGDSQDMSMSEDNPGTADSSSATNPISVNDPKKSASTTKLALPEDATVVTASTSSTANSSRSSASANALASANTASSVALAKDVVPKQELFFFYQLRPRKVHLKSADYLTWGNDKSVHELLYSSAFVCPITKEIFLAGSYGDSYVKEGGIHWYSTKKVAEHAAAARAWDCWNIREGRQGEKRMSLETPYLKDDAPELPMYQFPVEIREKIQEIQKEQVKLEEELKNKPPSPPRQYDDRYSNRGKSNRRDYDAGRRQGGAWNKRGRGRGGQYSSTYQRQQRYNGGGYNAGFPMEQQRGYESEQNPPARNYSSGNGAPSYAYNDRQHPAFNQQIAGNFSSGYGGSYHGEGQHASSRQHREQSNATRGSYSTGYDDSYSGQGQANVSAQSTRIEGNHNDVSQDFHRWGWQGDESRINASLPHTDAPAAQDEGPIQFRRLQDVYTNDDSLYPGPQNQYSDEW